MMPAQSTDSATNPFVVRDRIADPQQWGVVTVVYAVSTLLHGEEHVSNRTRQ